MKTPALLRTLSFKFQTRLSPSLVAPWPVRTPFDRWLTAELDELRHQPQQAHCYTSANWHLKALDIAAATQQMALSSIASNSHQCDQLSAHRKLVGDYSDNVVELLDACNSLRERMETINRYLNSLAIALHGLEGEHELSESAITRAKTEFDSCEAMEKRSAELDKCGSNLRKLGEKYTQVGGRSSLCDGTDTCPGELVEALNGSNSVALLVMGMLGIALSFKSKRGLGLPTMQSSSCKTSSWSCSLQELHKQVKEEMDRRRKAGQAGVLNELSRTVDSARELRDVIGRHAGGKLRCEGELREAAEGLRMRCGELKRGVKWFEGRIEELYRKLISIRMSLLGLVL